MIQLQGLWWPDDVGTKWQHALKHVRSLEFAIRACRRKRTAVQAGGNVGLWPRRLARDFATVITFEPDVESRWCLERNVPGNVKVFGVALGTELKWCGLKRKSLGSHRIIEGGKECGTMPLDEFGLTDVDLIQLDIEGYEWHALAGAARTIERCHPIIQVELRGFSEKYGQSDQKVRELLRALGYSEISRQAGSDVVFKWGQA